MELLTLPATSKDDVQRPPPASPPSSSPERNEGNISREKDSISPAITRRLFLSHFLSTWNSRVFEFGAVLFLAALFPGTLLPASLYALVRGVSAVGFAPTVGQYVDRENRLRVVRFSIVVQRAVTALSCAGFLLLTISGIRISWISPLVLFMLGLLACIEKLCSIMNTIAVERDWAVVIAGSNDSILQDLNSQMRRIDLFCKLVGPLAISLIDGISTTIAICVVLGLNVASVGVEYLAIARVYKSVEGLQQRDSHVPESLEPNQDDLQSSRRWCWMNTQFFVTFCDPLSKYLHHRVALPSIALSILYFTVLSFGAQMITYLITTGYTSTSIGLIRTASVFFEMSATWLSPFLMNKVGPIRTGLWFINWQLLCVGTAVATFWFGVSPQIAAIGLIVGVILSRVGLWGFDLAVQILVQEEVEPSSRGTFSSTEASLQSSFELLSFGSTVVFPSPDTFRYPALMSAGAVLTSALLYAEFVRTRRGHLIHVSSCIVGDPQRKERIAERSTEAREHLLG